MGFLCFCPCSAHLMVWFFTSISRVHGQVCRESLGPKGCRNDSQLEFSQVVGSCHHHHLLPSSGSWATHTSRKAAEQLMLVGCWKLMLGLALATNHVHQGKAKLLCWGSIFVVALPLLFVVAPLTLLTALAGQLVSLGCCLTVRRSRKSTLSTSQAHKDEELFSLIFSLIFSLCQQCLSLQCQTMGNLQMGNRW